MYHTDLFVCWVFCLLLFRNFCTALLAPCVSLPFFRVISVWFWHFYIVPFLQLLHFDYFQCFQPVLLFFSLCVLLASDTYFVFSQVNLVWNIYTTELIYKKLYKVMLLFFAIVLLSCCLCYYDTIHNFYNSFVYNLTWFIKT